MERLPTWVFLFILSIIIIAAGIDQVPEEARDGRAKYCLATSIISLLFSFFFIVANLVDRLGAIVVGNVIENVVSMIVVALWTVAIAFIQNPKNDTATSINEMGQEYIIFANLYFFSWLNFIGALYLFGNVLRDNLIYNPKFSQWVLLFASSIVLTATSTSLHDDICENAGQVQCGRLKYALAVGICGILFAFFSIFATMFGFMGKYLEIGSSFLCSAFYFFGVVVLTSSNGPASTLGNMYFSVWAGTFLSFTLLLGILFPNTDNPQQRRQHEVDDQI